MSVACDLLLKVGGSLACVECRSSFVRDLVLDVMSDILRPSFIADLALQRAVLAVILEFVGMTVICKQK